MNWAKGMRSTSLPDAWNWLKKGKEAPIPQDELFVAPDVDDLASNARWNYRKRYKHNIQPAIDNMRLSDVKPMYCKKVHNQLEAGYAGST
ncbi:MAG: hypothetical protein IJZ39_13040 [Oscillospiraceae bacterium]|nr:hypothetical protein [Oscillospiraceae bacterium]